MYCSANIYLLLYISHFLLIISCRHLKHTADKCTCAWEFKKPFLFCFITLRCIQAKINEQLLYGRVNLGVLIGSFLVRILPYGPFPWKRSSAVHFLFLKARKFKTSMPRVPYNKLLTKLASSSHTGEYWPSVVFVQTSLPPPRANIPQYCPCARLVRG